MSEFTMTYSSLMRSHQYCILWKMCKKSLKKFLCNALCLLPKDIKTYIKRKETRCFNEKQYFLIIPFVAFVCKRTFVEVAKDTYDKDSCAKTIL